jgi:D-alanine-D-alanine ligase
MKVAILHNAVADSDSAADRDVLVQVSAVDQALRGLGHATRSIPCTLNLELVEESLTMDKPEVVFNLVESLGGSDRLAHLAAVLLEDLELPFTGAPAATWHLTNNKPAAKAKLRANGLPTPDWMPMCDHADGALAPPYIIKAVWEHASLGLDDHALITGGDGSTVCEQIASRARQLGQACFAEQFVDGREFNLSLIAEGDSARVLPPAEIDFSGFPPGKPRIVGYAAKWEEQTFEFANTPRKFDFPEADHPLLDWLRTLALECWRLFSLAGYARVDFRVDRQGQPWILEINANPCLSPDAGFAAALARSNLPLERAIEWILEDAVRRKKKEPESQPGEVRGQRSEVRVHQQSSGAESVTSDARLSTQYSVLSTESAPSAPKRRKRGATIRLRTDVQPADCDSVRRIVTATGLFRPAEIDVAVELVEARLSKGASSGYEFAFAEQKGEVVGYICFGKNTLTVSSFDIYWIAVEPTKHGQGIGRLLLEEAERQIAEAAGTRIYIETSHRADYQATRGFYDRCGYTLEAILQDFYAPGDSKATYVKTLKGAP